MRKQGDLTFMSDKVRGGGAALDAAILAHERPEEGLKGIAWESIVVSL